MLVHNVLNIFIAEILKSAEHWIGSRLPQPAQACFLHSHAKIFKQIQIFHGSGTGSDSCQQGMHLRRAGAAGDAFSA